MGLFVSFEMRLLLLAFAVFRASELVTVDNGPLDVFARLRAWTGMYDRDEFGSTYVNASMLQKAIGALLECPYCAGVWFAFAGLLILVFVPFILEGIGWLWLVVVWLALAGMQSLLETVARRSKE